MNPTLTLVKDLPRAVASVPLPASADDAFFQRRYVVHWTLKAEFPAPYGTIYLRYAEPEKWDNCLDVLTPSGKRLQRLRNVSLMDTPLPARLSGRWLAPRERKGPLLAFVQKFPNDDAPSPIYVAFPDGFAGFCSISRAYRDDKKYVWNGLEFVEGDSKDDRSGSLSAGRFTAPELLAPTRLGKTTRFGAAFVKNRRYLLRWTNQGDKKFFLEILDASGRTLAQHRRPDGFDPGGIGAMWLDSKRHRNPILQTRDSDQVRLHVFSDDFRKLLCVQDFNDGSSSIAATTVAFERDKRGILEVWENYSERGDEDGNGGASSSTSYRWNGQAFQEVVKVTL